MWKTMTDYGKNVMKKKSMGSCLWGKNVLRVSTCTIFSQFINTLLLFFLMSSNIAKAILFEMY